MSSIVDDLLHGAQQWLERWGWWLVFSLIAMYMARPYVDRWMNERSLAHANDPRRRQLLDEERRRIRVHQQLDVYKAHREQKGTGAYHSSSA